jgi:hypothetical protein
MNHSHRVSLPLCHRPFNCFFASVSVVLLLIGTAADTSAGPISLAVDPKLAGGPTVQGFFEIDFFFGDQLDGIILSGQSLSLDFVFADDILARVLRLGEGGVDFGILLALETNAGTSAGLPGDDSTGFLIAPDGTPLHAPLDREWVGLLDVPVVGLFPQLLGSFEMAGVHYDLTLPSTGFGVTGGRIRLTSHNPWGTIQFGTVAQLPEPSTLLLIIVGLAGGGWGLACSLKHF